MSTEIKHIGDLHIDEDLKLQRRLWVFQRIGWGAIGIFVLLSLAGLLGPGPLSHTRLATPTLEIEFDRFIHYQAPSILKVKAVPRGQIAQVWISNEYLEKMRIENVSPEPLSVEAQASGYLYEFEAPSDAHPVTVAFEMEASKPGRLAGKIGNRSALLEFDQFVYP